MISRRALLWAGTGLLAALVSACAASPTNADDRPEHVSTESTATRVIEAAEEVVAGLSTQTSEAFVDAVAADGDERWVPWLIDLLRIDPSLATSQQISRTLAALTGIPAERRIPDLINYGSWSATRGLDGGPGYRPFKVGLYERIDPRFGPLLASVTDQATLAAIQWGGVPVGGIPELNEPARVPANQADWMLDDEVVLGVTVGDEAVAYPLRILARHEMANDTVGDRPVSIVYCTLCLSAQVFDRTVDGQVVRFLTSGLLSNSNKIMVDVETETLWSHLGGVGIGGPLDGVELTRLPVNHMRWSEWAEAHPGGEVLALPQPIFFDDPERPPIAYDYTPGAAYRSYYETAGLWFPTVDTPPVWPPKTEVLGLAIGDDAVALSLAELWERGEALVIEVGGMSITVEPTAVGARVLDAEGTPVPSERSFWFAWYANHPDTRTLEGLPTS